MKKLPFIIGIPLVALALVLGGAMVWKLKTQTTEIATTAPGPLPSAVSKAQGNKPSNAFGFLFGNSTSSTQIPTPTPASAAAMNADLQTVGDDGGAGDFSSLQQDVNGL